MSDDPHNGADAEKPKSGLKIKPLPTAKDGGREVSTIGFPYQDLEAGMVVARAMLSSGGVALSRDQLAGVMKQSAGSGAFVTKLATARMFGLVVANNGKYELTDTGFEILDSDEGRQKAAKATAFLNVPLFKKTYEEFKGKQLPPRPHGLEQAFVRFGVAPKQKTNARLAFDKSANQAGFFPNGQDRLIEPIISSQPPRTQDLRPAPFVDEDRIYDLETPTPVPTKPQASGGKVLHPFIQGLLDTLPEPQTNWSIEGRAKWLQAAANIFDLIYEGGGRIEIKSRTEDAGQ
ncbi:hypothetical protein A5906_00480 [Bradyrhizobium sacchari]|uniref:Uncharacterized protein n=1 Tax=Bradyrhizobium sacchari TaxID=1399419 RepID=A0A560KB41_9BRAD|nr:hypothetical protein [Bradyrhizobium sacchari]OPY96832.1 hypothetical protein A5906_00480 [Bradyrhizobium sacchari]TWB55527.1 hypothetical protein FBZ94_10743 [Bradyrhizobium sacchari]TWB79164.1 hypothetical protein FBZ95_1031016 [Bradyrhizobium sacchari]